MNLARPDLADACVRPCQATVFSRVRSRLLLKDEGYCAVGT